MKHSNLFEVTAYAKINVGLQITGCCDGGYHSIHSLMQAVELPDHITVSFDVPSGSGMDLSVLPEDLPRGSDNLLIRAARLWAPSRDFVASLHKEIPVGAGLGGGSADAAAMLALMARIEWNCLPEEVPDWCSAARSLGADVPFFVRGGTQEARGLGDDLTPVNSDCQEYVAVLLWPTLSANTGEVYRSYDALDPSKRKSRGSVSEVRRAMEAGALEDILDEIPNDLEIPALTRYPELREFREYLEERIGRPLIMTGSGACFYTLFRDPEWAKWEADRWAEAWANAEITVRSAAFRAGRGWHLHE